MLQTLSENFAEGTEYFSVLVKVFKDEFLHHIHNKSCTVRPGGYSSANPDLGKMAAD